MAGLKAVFTTARSERHQRDALQVAPAGLDVAMLRSPDRPALAAALADADYLVSERSGTIDAALLAAAPRLRLILRLGGLCHDIDLDAARTRGVVVCRRDQEGALRVAEFVVLQALALLRRLEECAALARTASDGWRPRRVTDENSFAYNWTGRRGLEGLHGRTVGILGFGEIGVALARRLAGWDCRLLYARRTALPEAIERDLGVTRRSDEDLVALSDILVCLLPFTPDTRLWLDDARLSTMRPGALLVSSGSGGIIDEAALARRVEQGELGGAALDTFAVEPLEDTSPLVAPARRGANLLLTPHVAAGAPADARAEFAAMFDPIRDHMAGREPAGRMA